MDIIELSCPNCGVLLQVDGDAESLNCPKCGVKIFLEEKEGVVSSVPEPASDRALGSQTAPDKSSNRSSRFVSILQALGLLTVVIIGLAFGWDVWQESILESIKNETENYIELKYFGRADSKARELIFEGFSPKKKEKWDGIREGLLSQIEEEKKEEKSNSDKIVPISADEAKKKSYTEVETEFRKAGFTNINCEPAKKKPLFPKVEKGDVKEIYIEINGKKHSSFKEKTVFPASSRITIVYYDFD